MERIIRISLSGVCDAEIEDLKRLLEQQCWNWYEDEVEENE